MRFSSQQKIPCLRRRAFRGKANEIPRRHSLTRDNLKAPCGAFKLHHFNFDVYAGWKIQRRETLDDRWSWVQDVDETLVNP